jgi:shikimate kinase
MAMTKPIFLIGPMGSGKSYLGKKLAMRCSLLFLDLDELIETGEGASISDLFATHGETRFRELEAHYLRQVPPHSMVATGGGTPCFHDNMQWINESGYSIFLDVSLPILVKRLWQEKAHRPLIAPLTVEELPDFLEKMLAQRKRWYRQAQFIYPVDSENLPVEEDIYHTFLKFIVTS